MFADETGDARRWSAAALVAVAAVSALQLAWLCEWPGHGVDDSLITQVYGRNLAEGSGWVYRPQGERVEGSTSFLYTLLWAAAFLTPAPRAVMHVVGFLLCVLALGLGQSAAVRLAGDGPPGRGQAASWWFVILAALFPPLVTWSTITLMDSSLWLALMMAAAWVLVRAGRPEWCPRHRAVTVALAALMPLTRPEGFVVAPLWIALVSLRPADVARRFDARTASLALAAFASTAVGITVFRWLYFGYPLPNTFYAKVSPSVAYNLREGATYLLHTLVRSPIAACALAVAAVAAMNRLRPGKAAGGSPARSAPGTLALLVLVLVAAPVVVGGDHFAQGRFLVPPLAMALVIAAVGLSRSTPATLSARVGGARAASFLCLFSIAAAAGARALQERTDPVQMEFAVGRDGLEFGRALSRVTAGLDPRPSWGVLAAGGTAFAYQGPIIDLLGLNNVAMAHAAGERQGRKNHAAFNREVFYQQAPDIVQESVFTECVNRPRRAFRRRLARGFTGEVQDEPEFGRRYAPMLIRLSSQDRENRVARTSDSLGPCVDGMALYVKRELAHRLAEAGAELVDLAGGPIGSSAPAASAGGAPIAARPD